METAPKTTSHPTLLKPSQTSIRSRSMARLRSSLGKAGTAVFISSTIILLLIIFIGIFVPLLGNLDPMAQSLRDRYQPPSSEHLLGTDALGRDVLARVIFGARTSLGIAIAAATISAVLGAMLGFLSGFLGGKLDTVITRLVDILMAFPMVLLAIIIITAMGSGILNLILAIVVSSLPRFVRLARSVALSIRESDFILASRSIGGNTWWQIVNHVVPNGIPLVIVLATARLGTVILTESSLSFLGLGVPPGTPSWGTMISEGRQVLREAPWLSLAPGLAIMLVVLCFNMLGDGLRDLLDPQMRGSGSGQ
jgi:peptide/nickel transport system permease protein